MPTTFENDHAFIFEAPTINQYSDGTVPDCECDQCMARQHVIRAYRAGISWLRTYHYTLSAHYIGELEYGLPHRSPIALDLPINDNAGLAAPYLPYIVLFQFRGNLFYTTIDSPIVAHLQQDDRFDHETLYRFQEEVVPVAVTGICDICGEQMSPGYKVGKYKVHRSCARQYGYHSGNNLWLGEDVKLPSFSIEFEMHRETSGKDDQYDNAVIELIKHGFRRTSDGTVTDEMVSPIYRSNAGFLLSLPTMQAARKYVDSECGSHIHTGMTGYPRTYLQQHVHSLLFPLLAYMEDTENTFPLIWGRSFCSFADSDLDGRYSFINVSTGYDTIEYRLAKFVSDRQYRYLVQFVRLFSKEYTRLYNRHLRTNCSGERLTSSVVGIKLLSFYKKFESWALPRLERN